MKTSKYNNPILCLPHSDSRFQYFRFYTDGGCCFGWFPKKFTTALLAYMKPWPKAQILNVQKVAKYRGFEFLCVNSKR